VYRVKEAQVLHEPTKEPNDRHWAIGTRPSLDRPSKAEPSQRGGDRRDDLRIRVVDPQNSPAVRTLSVEEAGKEAPFPWRGRGPRPTDGLLDGSNAVGGLVTDRPHVLVIAARGLEQVLAAFDALREEVTRSSERFEIDERETEAVSRPWLAIRTAAVVMAERAVASDHPGEIAGPILRVVVGL